MRQLPHCFRCHKGVAFYTNMIIDNASRSLVILDADIVNLNGLSLEAIGLAAKITYIEANSKSHNDAVLKSWKMIADHGYESAYKQLVNAEIILDILEDICHG